MINEPFSRARFSVIGCPVGQLVKVTGSTVTFRAMPEDMNFDAGRVLNGDLTLAEAGRKLAALILRIARGEPSKPEALEHREYFIMYKHQNTPSPTEGCRA